MFMVEFASMGIPNCASGGFAEMEFGSENKRGKCMGELAK
jgi:hypothetical protein